MRAMLDTNIYVSYLLTPDRATSVTHRVIDLVFSEVIDLTAPLCRGTGRRVLPRG